MGDVTAFRMKVTPRQRELLRVRLWVYADILFDEVEEHGDAPVDPTGWWVVAEQLPRCTWNQNADWRRDMARAFDDLAGDMDAGMLPYPCSVAEHLALRVAIAGAQTAMIDHDYSDEVDALPQHAADRNWDSVIAELMTDRGTDALYSPDPHHVSASLAVVPIDTWFHTFPDRPSRALNRGYRR